MKVGLIGGGFGVDGYLAALSGMSGIQVAAVADSGSGRVLSRLPDHRLYRSSWRELLDPSIDMVCVVTPPATHLEIVLELIRCGKHVLCEKPFGSTPIESRLMVTAAASASVVAGVSFQYRFEPGFQVLKAMLDDGCIGELQSVDCNWLTSGRRDPLSPWTWRNDASQGGGVVGAFLSHVVDLLHWLSGAEVRQVEASTAILVERRPLTDGSVVDVSAEDQVKATMTLATGVRAFCHISNCHLEALGMRMEFVGSNGRLLYTHKPPFTAATQELHLSSGGSMMRRVFCAEQKLGKEARDTRLPALRGLIERFTQRARGGGDDSDWPSFEDGLAVQRVLAAVRRSAATHADVLC